MYVVIRDYRDEAPDVIAEVAAREEGLKETMRGVKGLVAYYVVDTGNGGVATVSIVEDQAGADESIKVAAAWVRENMAQWAPKPPTIIQGEVVVSIS